MRRLQRLLCILLFGLFFAPGYSQIRPPAQSPSQAMPVGKDLSLTVYRSEFLPGTPLVIAVERTDLSYARARLLKDGQRVVGWQPAFRQNGAGSAASRWFIFVPLGPLLDPGTYTLRLEAETGSGKKYEGNIPVKLLEREFEAQTIPLTRQLTEVRTANPQTRATESENLTLLLAQFNAQAWYNVYMFQHPLRQSGVRQTSQFASRRVFVYGDGTRSISVHAGRDYGAPTGTPILAPAPGRVVYVGNRQVTGNTVVLEHGPGIYTMYYHMERIMVTQGALIGADRQLGTVGATGLATGPHLHWEVRMALEMIDPEYYMERPFLDSAILLW